VFARIREVRREHIRTTFVTESRVRVGRRGSRVWFTVTNRLLAASGLGMLKRGDTVMLTFSLHLSVLTIRAATADEIQAAPAAERGEP
jgi:hypothetical protein